jgi:hypothetical protein
MILLTNEIVSALTGIGTSVVKVVSSLRTRANNLNVAALFQMNSIRVLVVPGCGIICEPRFFRHKTQC